MSILKDKFEENMANENWKFSSEVHNQYLELIPHTTDCIIHRFSDYFKGQYQFHELDKCQGRFGCDFINYDNVNRLSFQEYNYNLQLKIPCTYENYNNDPQTDNKEVVLINKKDTWYRPHSIFELIFENIISINDEMKNTLNQSVV